MNLCELKAAGDSAYTAFDVTVAISDYEEWFEVLDGENAGRSQALSARMIRDVIGTFVGHNITFFSNGNNDDFNALWTWLKTHSVDESVFIRAADNNDVIEYECYYTAGRRKMHDSDGTVNRWEAISVNFVPMEAAITP